MGGKGTMARPTSHRPERHRRGVIAGGVDWCSYLEERPHAEITIQLPHTRGLEKDLSCGEETEVEKEADGLAL